VKRFGPSTCLHLGRAARLLLGDHRLLNVIASIFPGSVGECMKPKQLVSYCRDFPVLRLCSLMLLACIKDAIVG
jgi:hypothetical protein